MHAGGKMRKKARDETVPSNALAHIFLIHPFFPLFFESLLFDLFPTICLGPDNNLLC